MDHGPHHVPDLPSEREVSARSKDIMADMNPCWLVILAGDNEGVVYARTLKGYSFVDSIAVLIERRMLIAVLLRSDKAVSLTESAVLYGCGLAIDDSRVGAGRWPTNTIAVHNASCKKIGKRALRGDPRSAKGAVLDGKRPKGFFNVGSQAGSSTPGARVYGNKDGLEWVDDYQCDPSCPVATMSKQEDGANRFFPNLFKEELLPWLVRLVR